MTRPTEGETYTFRRTFTAEEVRLFADLSGDAQARHTDPDADGRVLVHGLLTGTLPTKLGGDLAVLARSMDLEFVRPVYTGQPITCTWTTETVTERDDRYDLDADVTCENESGDVVLRAAVEGLVEKDD